MCLHALSVDGEINDILGLQQTTVTLTKTAVAYRMCLHAYAVDVGNFSSKTC